MAAAIFCWNGCGSANDEKLGTTKSEVVAPKPGAPQYSSYGEMMQTKAREAAKNKGGASAQTKK